MAQLKAFLTTLLFFLIENLVNSQKFESPCPRLFEYTGQNNITSQLFGSLVLSSETDLFGVWLQLIFDRPSLQLENSFGELVTTNNKEYFIEEPNFELKANITHRLWFTLEYAPNEPTPKLLSFKLNGKLVCPEESQSTNLENICGTITQFSKDKPVNSEPSYNGAFPWHAIVVYLNREKIVYACQASLISKYYVITTTRCIVNTTTQTPLKSKEIGVLLGKHHKNDFANLLSLQHRKVAQIIPHPLYNAETNLHNIALVKLAKAAVFTDYVRPVCLWQESRDPSLVLNKLGTVVGVGFDVEAKSTNQIIQTKASILPQETCINSVPNVGHSAYCAKYKEGTTICNDYEGASMVFLQPNFQRIELVWQLRGLVSTHPPAEKQPKCNVSHYIEFTDTANYIDWITNSIK